MTLLIDPGRIKRGVATNDRLGSALHAGQDYTLVVEAGWQTADGQHRLPKFEKPFTVVPALRTLPSIEQWHIVPPTVSTREPLLIELDRPFDYELLHKRIQIIDADGRQIQGDISVNEANNTWSFQPNQSWQTDAISAVVDATLEDVAGNNLKDLLDHQVSEGTKDIEFIYVPIELQ